jgi:hypothetical protein
MFKGSKKLIDKPILKHTTHNINIFSIPF